MNVNEQNFPVSGPFYNGKQAARFCGFSYGYFRHLASEYRIPRCGPNFNRYPESILNLWMSNPSVFIISASPNRKKLKKLEVKA